MRQTDMLQKSILTNDPSNARGALRPNLIALQKQILDASFSPNERQAQQTQYVEIDAAAAEIERRDGSVSIVQLGE